MAGTFRSARERVRARTMLTRCAEPGCETFVLGGFCLEHDAPQTRIFVRGRPFVSRLAPSPPADRAPLTLVRTTGSMALVGESQAAPEGPAALARWGD